MTIAQAVTQDAIDECVAQIDASGGRAVKLVEKLTADLGNGGTEGSRGKVGAMVEVVIVEFWVDVPTDILAVAGKRVPGVKMQVLAQAAAEAVVVGVARRQVILLDGARLALRPLVIDGSTTMILPSFVAVADAEVHVGTFCLSEVVGLASLPAALLPRLGVIVQIIGIGYNSELREVRVAHGEETGQVASAGAAASLYVGKPTYHILLLQPYVYNVALCALVLDAQPFVLCGLLVVDGDVLYHVGGQVLQHQFAVSAEELLAVQQQVVHKLAVVVDASVGFHLHARQLP